MTGWLPHPPSRPPLQGTAEAVDLGEDAAPFADLLRGVEGGPAASQDRQIHHGVVAAPQRACGSATVPSAFGPGRLRPFPHRRCGVRVPLGDLVVLRVRRQFRDGQPAQVPPGQQRHDDHGDQYQIDEDLQADIVQAVYDHRQHQGADRGEDAYRPGGADRRDPEPDRGQRGQALVDQRRQQEPRHQQVLLGARPAGRLRRVLTAQRGGEVVDVLDQVEAGTDHRTEHDRGQHPVERTPADQVQHEHRDDLGELLPRPGRPVAQIVRRQPEQAQITHRVPEQVGQHVRTDGTPGQRERDVRRRLRSQPVQPPQQQHDQRGEHRHLRQHHGPRQQGRVAYRHEHRHGRQHHHRRDRDTPPPPVPGPGDIEETVVPAGTDALVGRGPVAGRHARVLGHLPHLQP